MRKYILMVVAGIMLVISSCKDKVEETYEVNAPVYMGYDELRSSLKVAEPKDIVQPGKIYFKDNYIFVNEYHEGIHVVNNNDPSNPIVEHFIEIPGNVDLAIKGNNLYADSYVDLVTLDISNLNDIREVDRDTNVFPYYLPVLEDGYIDYVDESKGVVVGYALTKKTERIEQNNHWRYYRSYEFSDAMTVNATSSAGGPTNIGTGGSMARFTLYEDYLYIVDEYQLNLFDVGNTADPEFTQSIGVGWNIETIFPYNEMLFIGSQTGMYIYSLENAAEPQYISEFRHASSCDPVVVEGDYAYVTLRGGNLCGAMESELDVIDVSNIEYPELLKSYSMQEPYGLGINNDVLFVCDGDAGLKIYNAENKLKIDSNMVAHYSDINAFDVIPLTDVLIMIGVDGLYQYDYSDLENISLLSYIPIYND